MSHQSHVKGQTTTDWLVGAVKNNPEGLLLLAAGCALLLRSGTPGRGDTSARKATSRGREGAGGGGRGQSSPATAGMTAGLSEAAENVRDYASDLGKTVSDKASTYAASVGEYAEGARRTVAEQSERLAEQTRTTMQSTVGRVLQEQPLALALAGLAAGAALAAAFPATDTERQTLGPAGERVVEVAGDVGQRVSQAATQAGERLKDIADERGLNSEGLKAAAGDVAGAFGDAFKGGETRAEGQSSGAGSYTRSAGSSQSSGTAPSSSDKPNKPGATRQT